MRKRHTLSVTAVLVAAITPAAARANGVIETFNYGSANVGLPIFGLPNPMTADPWAEANSSVASFPLLSASPVIPTSPGGSLVFTSATTESSPRIPISEISLNTPGTTLYYSFDFVLTDATGLGSTPAPLAAFNNSTGTQTANPAQLGTLFLIRRDANNSNNFNVGVARNHNSTNPPGSFAFHTGSYPIGTPVRIVGSYTVNGTGTGGTSATDDRHSIWVNPGSAGAPLEPAPDASTLGGDIATGLLSFVALGGLNRPAGYAFGNLRAADYWAGVNPAPGTNWPGGSGTWAPSSLAADPAPGASAPDALSSGPGETFNFNPGGGIIDLPPGGVTAGHIYIQSPEPYTFNGPGILTLNPGDPAGTAAIKVLPVLHPTTGVPQPATHTISAPISIPADAVARFLLTVGASQTLSITGGVTGAAPVVKDGAGTVVFGAGSSPLPSPFTIREGEALFADLAPIPSDITLQGGYFGIDFNPPAALTVNVTVPTTTLTTQRVGGFDLHGHSVTFQNSLAGNGRPTIRNGLLQLADANTITGLDLAANGTVAVATDAALGAAAAINVVGPGAGLNFLGSFAVNSSRNLNMGTFGATITVAPGQTVTYAAPIQGASGLTKAGPGTLVLNNISNNFSGILAVNGGTLSTGSSNFMGTNSLDLAGGTLATTSSFSFARGLIVESQGGTLRPNAGTTLTLNRNAAGTIAIINGPVTFAGGTTTLSWATGVVNFGPAGRFIVDPNAALRLNVASTATFPVIDIENNGNLFVQNANRTFGKVVGTGVTEIAVNLIVAIAQVRQAAARVRAGATLTIQGAAGAEGSELADLTIEPGAKVELGSEVILSFMGFDITADDLDAYILNQSLIAEGGNKPLGYAPVVAGPNAPTGLIASPATLADDATLSPTLIVRATVFGDANLNRIIDPDDYALTDFGFLTQPADFPWYFGDYNYDEKIDSADYALIDQSFALQSGGTLSPAFLSLRESQFGPAYVQSLLASIPEPTLGVSSILYPFSALLLPRSRRRRPN